MKSHIAEAKKQFESLLESWNHLVAEIESLSEDQPATLPIPSLGISIKSLGDKIDLIAGEINKLPEVEEDAWLSAPPLAAVTLLKSIGGAQDKISSAVNSISGGSSIDLTTFQVTAPHKNPTRRQQGQTTQYNLDDIIHKIASDIDKIFSSLAELKSEAPSKKASTDFPNLLQRIRKVVKQAESAKQEILNRKTEVEKAAGQAGKAEDAASTSRDKAEGAAQEATSNNDTISRLKGESEQQHAAIESILAEARALQAQIQEASPELTAFRDNLTSHRNELDETKKTKERLIKSLNEIQEEINEKNNMANDMLSNVTIAGLASSFGRTRDNLDIELKSARKTFYMSIGVLVILASPLFLYIFPIWGFGAPRDGTPLTVARDLIARLALLLPGVWLVGFAATRHSALFKLREHYQYKYNMAASVDGFKTQAPALAPEIAGTTFFEILTRNPADAIDGRRQATEYENPQPLLSQIMQRLKRGKRAEPDGEG